MKMAIGSIHNLAKRVEALAERAEKGMAAKVSTAAIVAGDFAIDHTPVDTGKARSSWMGMVGFKPLTIRNAYVEYEALRSAVKTEEAGRFFEEDNAEAAKDAIRDVLIDYMPYEEIVIANNLDYLPVVGTLQVDPFLYAEAGMRGREAAREVKVLDERD